MARGNRFYFCSYRRRGISRIAVIVIAFVIVALFAFALPAIQKAREAAWKTRCTENLKRFGVALHDFEGIHQGIVPATLATAETDGMSPAIEDGITWCALFLPFMENAKLWAEFNAGNAEYWPGYMSEGKSQLRDVALSDAAKLSTFYCPSRRTGMRKCLQGSLAEGDAGACGDYAGVTCNVVDNLKWFNVLGNLKDNGGAMLGAERYLDPLDESKTGILWRCRTTFATVTDGLSNTFFVGEKHLTPQGMGTASEGDGSVYYYNSRNPRTIEGGKFKVNAASYSLRRIKILPEGVREFSIAQGVNAPADDTQFGSSHTGVTLFAMCDGAVKHVRNNADFKVLSNLGDRHDGTAVCVDDH